MEQIKAAEVGVECGKEMVSGLLYAVDVVIISPDERKLQKLISIVEEWHKKWTMTLNLDQGQNLCFRMKKSPTQHNKYLGLVLMEHLEWDLVFLEMHKKASRGLALLKHKARIHVVMWRIPHGYVHISLYTANNYVQWMHLGAL